MTLRSDVVRFVFAALCCGALAAFDLLRLDGMVREHSDWSRVESVGDGIAVIEIVLAYAVTGRIAFTSALFVMLAFLAWKRREEQRPALAFFGRAWHWIVFLALVILLQAGFSAHASSLNELQESGA